MKVFLVSFFICVVLTAKLAVCQDSPRQLPKYWEVDLKRFLEVKDSLHNTKGATFSYHSAWYEGLADGELEELLSHLKVGWVPYYQGSGFGGISNGYTFYPKGSATVIMDTTYVCVQRVEDDVLVLGFQWISGSLDLHPIAKMKRDEMLAEWKKEAKELEAKKGFWLKDTLLENGTFLEYHNSDSLRIDWGNSSIRRRFPITYENDAYGVEVPRLSWASDSFIGVEIGCGTECWMEYVLPLSEAEPVQLIWYPLTINEQTNTVAFIDTSARNLMHVLNLKSKWSFDIKLNYECLEAGIGSCLESVELRHDSVILKYPNKDASIFAIPNQE